MNFGIIISYVIAGFLMLTILTVSYNVGYSNQEVATTNIKQTHSLAITQILINDIPKIGYDKKAVLTTKFEKADSVELSFFSNLDNSGSVEKITWKYYPQITPEHAKNPHARILTRTIDGDETALNAGVTAFTIRYYDNYGASTPMPTPINTSNFDDIVQIEIEMELQSDYELNYRVSDSGNYVNTIWKKRFSPVNLRPN